MTAINPDEMVGMHRKFFDLNCSLMNLTSDLQGILFIFSSKADAEKIKFSVPPATAAEVCDASISENLFRLEAMLEDAKMLVNRINAEIGVGS